MAKLPLWGTVILVILTLNIVVDSKISNSSGKKEVTIRCKNIKLKHGRTRYRQKSGFLQSTCDSGYILAGDKYMKCQNGTWEGVKPVCVRDTCKNQRDPINGFVYPSHRGGVLNFFCKPGFDLNGPTTAFCDGENWSTHLPICIQSNKTVSISCDFESPDICGWTHDLNHNFDWARHNRETPSAFIGTGPSNDHTLGPNHAGYYMYIEASRKNPLDTARLISPVYPAQENGTCLQFWYHMYGATMGELRVYVHFASRASWSFNGSESWWTRKGNHGNRWIRGFVDLGVLADNFQIIFEAVRGGNYMSDTALDDVKILENCEGLEEEDTTSTTEESSTDDGQEYLQSWSCYNRCDVNITEYSGYPCSCLWDCYDQQSCCPDYEAYCLDVSTLEESFGSTTEANSFDGEDTTLDLRTNQFVDDAAEVPLPTGQDASYEDHETVSPVAISTTIKRLPTTTITTTTTTTTTTTPRTTPKLTSGTTIKTTTATTTRTTTTTAKPLRTTPKLKPIKPLITPNPKTTSKPTTIKTNPPIKVPSEPPINPEKKTITKIPPPRVPIAGTSAGTKKDLDQDVLDAELNQVLRETNERGINSPVFDDSPPIQKQIGISFLGVIVIGAAVAIAIVALVVGIKMRRRVIGACQSMRMRRGAPFDSQSDVRFLTSDEVLDFTLASSSL